jgi:hypothetical protein
MKVECTVQDGELEYGSLHTVTTDDWSVCDLLHTPIFLRIHCSIHGEPAGGPTCFLSRMYFENKSIVRTQSKERMSNPRAALCRIETEVNDKSMCTKEDNMKAK